METLDQRIVDEVAELVSIGASHNDHISRLGRSIDAERLAKVSMWVTRLGQLILKLYGKESQHYVSYKLAIDEPHFYNLHSNHFGHFTQMLGVAFAVKHDIDRGLLADIRSIAQADVFADFLEMGEYLLSGGFKDAAAVIIGSVLEDALRKLSIRGGISITSTDGKPLTIDPLNAQLAKREVYSKLVQKQITSWAHIRNKAAHGEYSEYNKEQVQMMLLFVQNFCAEHL